jgi:hypothetical protein
MSNFSFYCILYFISHQLTSNILGATLALKALDKPLKKDIITKKSKE